MTTAPIDPTTPRADRLGPDFHRFWGAGVFTNLGDGMLAVALPLIAVSLTQDPLLVSGLTAVRFLPWLLLAPLSGVLIDRVHRMRAMVVSNTIAALVMVALLLTLPTGNLSIPLLYAAMFAVICCETVTDPASRIAVVRLVPARLLDRANSRVEGGRLVAQDCLGRPVAGFLFAAGAAAPLLGIAGSYALCVALLCAIPMVWRRSVPVTDESATVEPEGFRRSTGEGFRLVFGDRILRGNMLCNAGMMIGANMGGATLVLYAHQGLGVPAVLFGVFTLSSALGGVLAALVTDRLIVRLGRRTVVLGGYLGVAAASVAVGLAPDPYTAFAFLLGLGLCLVAANIAAVPYHQTVVPERVRGRVAGVSKMIGWGVTPLGALAGGMLGRIDLALPFLVGGLIMAVTALLARGVIAETARRVDRVLAETTETPGSTEPRR
ncbi:MFS transporter [Nocardiopsis sp. MG754419]|uniref:MFS transporter n=1 Tax=Nocardiopsis sp. MG754419 TaxID=2259865 RepID=UPI001BA93A6F|nr:MFS transporter [Nocardiopsis sp. MG754419]MBR8744735.1 MFS transporter [Nocardiopsis sp. MG754419]